MKCKMALFNQLERKIHDYIEEIDYVWIKEKRLYQKFGMIISYNHYLKKWLRKMGMKQIKFAKSEMGHDIITFDQMGVHFLLSTNNRRKNLFSSRKYADCQFLLFVGTRDWDAYFQIRSLDRLRDILQLPHQSEYFHIINKIQKIPIPEIPK